MASVYITKSSLCYATAVNNVALTIGFIIFIRICNEFYLQCIFRRTAQRKMVPILYNMQSDSVYRKRHVWIHFTEFSYKSIGIYLKQPMPVTVQSRRGSAGVRLLGCAVRIPPRAWRSVSCECCVLSGRGLCDGPITRAEESYCLCVCLWVWSDAIMNLCTDSE
jgi:hypothetical protein